MSGLALLLLVGCSGDKGDTATGDAPTWYQDVEPIVTARCASCHYDGGIAPFALDSYEAASARAGAMASATSAGVMPPYPPDTSCNSYRYDRSLSDEQIQTLSDWADADAPEGDATNPGAPLDVEVESLSRVDVELALSEPYTPTDSPDEYRCFPFEWTEGATYVTGFGVTPGEPRVVHHVIAYGISGDDAEAVAGWDADDPGAGYACYGGPNPSRGSDDRVSSDWIGGWVPGSSGSDLPEGLGIRIEEGSIIVVQIHYNMETAGALPDQTSVQFKIDDAVDDPATVAKVFDPTWILDEDAMLIPAGEEATYSYDLSLPADLTLYRVGLHMHQIGQSASLVRIQDDGTETCLLDIPDWDFHWQGSYELAEPLSMDRGDTVRLSCSFDNTGAEDVAWGEGSSDEMCLGLATVTVR